MRLDGLAHRVEPRGVRGGHPGLRRRRRAVRERLLETLDDLAEPIDRCSGSERPCDEATVEQGLPGVHDDNRAACLKTTHGLDRAPRPVRAVICRDHGSVERSAAVGHDQQRDLGVMEQLG